jgi:LPXTG-motif cell wall-anchored protein
MMRTAILLAAILVGLGGAAPAAAAAMPDPCVRVEGPSLPDASSCPAPAANAARGGAGERRDTVLNVPTAPPEGYGAPQRSDLPSTGPDVSGLLTIGAAMVLAGVVLVTVRRRGATSTLAPAPSDADFAWYAPTVELPVWHRPEDGQRQ